MSGGRATTWQVSLVVEEADVAGADAVLEEAGALSVASFELEPGGAWSVTGLFDAEPPAEGLSATLTQTLSAGGLLRPLGVEPVAERDWVAETVRAFPPIAIGPFWVHGSHVAPPDASRIPLLIDAGTAFGSGEHATTEGCLLALAELHDAGFRPGHALDMGCGSGILAIATAKLFGCPVLAVDIDPASVAFAREAADANGCGRLVTTAAGDGYATTEVAAAAPFDLVTANILANPLIAMAPSLAACLAAGGRAVLSGLLAGQADAVEAAHRVEGLSTVARNDLRGWTTLVMTRR